MTIEFRPPGHEEERALRELFTEAFGDGAFTELFFRTGYSAGRCMAAFDGELLAAAHWFDCTVNGKKAAYLYGIAAFRRCRGRGIGSALVGECVRFLGKLGYEIIALVPAEPSLFGYYERLGFRTVGTVSEQTVRKGEPLPLRRLSTEEYAQLRRRYLPENGVIQEGSCLALFGGYASFYATANAVAAVTGSTVWELLGDVSEAPGLLASLGIGEAEVRTPGDGRPFAMAVGADAPIYLGLAFD